MKFLAISGSARADSTNTAMLRALRLAGRPEHDITVFADVGGLPVFSPDREGDALPAPVATFAGAVAAADGLIIASPEYVRTIPGGLKNAIDWLVSRDEIIAKPIALMHASHRGDDMLAHLRIVLATVSARFSEDIFLRFPLMALPPERIAEMLAEPANRDRMRAFLESFSAYCALG